MLLTFRLSLLPRTLCVQTHIAFCNRAHAWLPYKYKVGALQRSALLRDTRCRFLIWARIHCSCRKKKTRNASKSKLGRCWVCKFQPLYLVATIWKLFNVSRWVRYLKLILSNTAWGILWQDAALPLAIKSKLVSRALRQLARFSSVYTFALRSAQREASVFDSLCSNDASSQWKQHCTSHPSGHSKCCAL